VFANIQGNIPFLLVQATIITLQILLVNYIPNILFCSPLTLNEHIACAGLACTVFIPWIVAKSYPGSIINFVYAFRFNV